MHSSYLGLAVACPEYFAKPSPHSDGKKRSDEKPEAKADDSASQNLPEKADTKSERI
jgi:hypothetical protein